MNEEEFFENLKHKTFYQLYKVFQKSLVNWLIVGLIITFTSRQKKRREKKQIFESWEVK